MKITNRFKLPDAFMRMATNDDYTPKPDSFGATTLLLPAQEIVLRRRFDNEMEQDVSDMISMLFGTAVHSILEKHQPGEFTEMYLKHQIDDLFVSGKIDLYDEKAFEVIDYKTTNTNKIIYDDFADWRMQGLIYAWLLIKNGHIVERLKFIALLKDWSKFKAMYANGQDNYYPEAPVYVYEFKVHSEDLTFIDNYIRDKLTQIKRLQAMDNNAILNEPLEESFMPKKRYAVKGPKSTRAKRVFDRYADAVEYAGENDLIEEREEENIKFEIMCQAIKHARRIQKLEEV